MLLLITDQLTTLSRMNTSYPYVCLLLRPGILRTILDAHVCLSQDRLTLILKSKIPTPWTIYQFYHLGISQKLHPRRT